MIYAWLGVLALASSGSVTVPLEAWEAAREALRGPAADAVEIPAVGSASWSGTTDPETLAIALIGRLQVELGQGRGTRQIPLLGTDAVLQQVTVGGRPVPVGIEGAHHTWRTDARGPQLVEVHALIPASGQRGALEYDFRVPQTPATHLGLLLPRPDLKPEVEHAVRTEIRSEGGQTRLIADLAPTSRIAVVGLRDLGQAEHRAAKLYAEGVHLLSVDEHRLELFTVVHYSILYAGARSFDVLVPEGLRVVSADGEGAFRYTLEPTAGGNLLRGETAYPIRNRYEISLRLQRELPSETFGVDLPRPVGVERVHGWVGVEAPGRVQLDTIDADGLLPLDPRQLPEEVRDASVSPILGAWRASSERGRVRLSARPLPEVDVDAESIDHVDARSVVSANGRVSTELRLRMRNRIRHGLTMTLPEGTTVVRAARDGAAIAPSQADDQHIVLPLRRSGADDPLVLDLVLASETDIPRLIGRSRLQLPAVDLPVSSLSWSVHWPAGTRASGLHSDVRSQRQVGTGRWLADSPSAATPILPQQALAVPEAGPSGLFTRHWIPSDTPIHVYAWHTAPILWLIGTGAGLGAMLLLLVSAWAVRRRRGSTDRVL